MKKKIVIALISIFCLLITVGAFFVYQATMPVMTFVIHGQGPTYLFQLDKSGKYTVYEGQLENTHGFEDSFVKKSIFRKIYYKKVLVLNNIQLASLYHALDNIEDVQSSSWSTAHWILRVYYRGENYGIYSGDFSNYPNFYDFFKLAISFVGLSEADFAPESCF